MQTNLLCEQSIETVATTAIQLGRQFADMAQEVHAGGNSRSVDFISSSLRRINDRNPFDDRDDGSLKEVRRIIEADLKTETKGFKTQYIEVGYDGDGPVIEAREAIVYTGRGEDLVRLLDVFDRFMMARVATLDRVAAERAVRQLASGY